MADDKKGPGPQEEKIFARLQAAAGQGPTGLVSFTGLLGSSSKAGFWRLYLGLDMSKYVEIKETDIVHTEQLPADRSPFGSLGGTQVFVKQDAQVTVTQCSSNTQDAGAASDEFDLDIRLGAGARKVALLPGTRIGGGAGGTCDTCFTQCDDTCPRTQCETCVRTQCITCPLTQCQTRCNQNTCQATCQQTCTCQTCANQNTCQQTCTCQTQCNQQTCATCNQQTCVTCNTCRTRCNQPTCPRTQCDNTCDDTCFRTCATCQRPCPLPF